MDDVGTYLETESQAIVDQTAGVTGYTKTESDNLLNAKAALQGDNTKTFKVADAINADEAVSKAQNDLKAPLSNPIFNTSVGIGIAPSDDLANGKGIALGDSDTGFRQNGDGVLEHYANNQLKASVTSAGFNFTDMLKIAGTDVIEQSSNANGFYIKFSAGFLIQFRDNYLITVDSGATDSFSWTFPIAAPNIWGYQDVAALPKANTLDVVCGLEGTPNFTSLSGFIKNNNSYSVDVTLRFLHLSYWK